MADKTITTHILTYKKQTGIYQNGLDAMLGRWNVGSVFWDGMRSKDDPKTYKVTCRLPGIKDVVGNFEKEEDAKSKLQEVVNFWMWKTI